MKHGYVLGVNVCLTTIEDKASVRVESECLSHIE
jgi:hypothetical protein